MTTSHRLLFLLFITSVYFSITIIQGRVYDRFDLAQELYAYGFSNITLWMCIMYEISGKYDTSFNDREHPSDEGGFGYGIFQLYDPYWCLPRPEGGGGCKIDCNKFLDDDITDDVACVKTVLERQGIDAWEHPLRRCEKSKSNYDVPDWVWSKTDQLDIRKGCPPRRDRHEFN